MSRHHLPKMLRAGEKDGMGTKILDSMEQLTEKPRTKFFGDGKTAFLGQNIKRG